MNRRRWINLVLVGVILAAFVLAIGLVNYYQRLPQNLSQHETIVIGQNRFVLSQHETIVIGQNRFVPGSQAAVRVLVRDSKDGSPLEHARVEVDLQPDGGAAPVHLYSGTTGDQGMAEAAFRVPDDAAVKSSLVVRTISDLGEDTVERPVTIEREYRVLLTTDKPIYQPGQVIHLRALSLSSFDLFPAAEQPLEIVIADGKGNKVFRQTLTTSAYGVAFTDFQLAPEVNTGAYKISASSGSTSSEMTVTVEPYVLPKFDITLQTGKSFYMPGEPVEGSLQARYFFGKPVADSQVKIEGFTFDIERVPVFTIEGQTDSEGVYNFNFDLPAYFTGNEYEGGMARFYLEASVLDQAQHSEAASLSLPVSSSTLTIQAVPEGGYFRPGIENILYVLTGYPDGTPAETNVTVSLQNSGQSMNIHTGPYGLAEIRMTPDLPYQYIVISASDAQGNSASQEFQFEGGWFEESILLRPDQPVYKVGQTMQLAVLTSASTGTVYLDMVRDGQTVSTRSVDVVGGKAEIAVDLTPDLFGTLELHAYKISSSGSITRDTRLVAVAQADDLQVAVVPGQEIYKPGDTAAINLQVNGKNGEGVQSAVGLAIVDESVFALAETDPGFAKLYFLLEKELMQPRFDIHGYSLPDLMRGVPEPDPALEQAASAAAQASLSETTRQSYMPGVNAFSLMANSHEDAMQRAYARQAAFFTAFSKLTLLGFLVIPIIFAGVCLAALRRDRSLGLSLLVSLAILGWFLLVFLLAPAPQGYTYGTGAMDRFSGWMTWLTYEGQDTALLFLLVGLLGYAGLVIAAVRGKDGLLGWMLFLLPLFLAVLVLLGLASSNSSFSPSDWLLIAGVAAFFLMPAALLVRLSGFVLKRRFGMAFMMLPLVLLLTIGLVPLMQSGFSQRVTAQAMGRGGMVEFEGAMPAMVEAPMMDAAGNAAIAVEEKALAPVPTAGPQQQGGGAEPPRLRQYFPETMLWLPDVVTGPDGSAVLEIPVADSITTWRMTALASSQDGRLGSTSGPLVVFQDFFIDLDLPLSLTVNDEVAVPVGVFNYLNEEQSVRLELQAEDWFDLVSEPVQEMTIPANDISVVYFRIRATRFGMQPFQVTAIGSKMSDAIKKQVRVYPDGKEITFTQSDQLESGTPVQQSVMIPEDAIAGTQKLVVKVYPGILSQVVEGLDSILRMPNGCFEQTSSTTYPNVLVLDYLKTTNQVAPEVQMKAEEYINIGYQRLATFEVDSSGGFSLFGDDPADRMLTAYGLQEFSDMARVYSVDPDLVRRAAEWLFSQQSADGSWENDQGLVHESTWSSLGDDRLPVTAYITWSLIEAGFIDDEHTQRGLEYVREFQGQEEDPYVLGLVANALVAADLNSGSQEISKNTEAVLDRLAAQAIIDGDEAYWESSVATFMGSEGKTGSVETTALAALALLKAESHPDVANGALLWLVRQKDSYGTWYSTQATVLTLKALLQSVRGSAERTNATVTISLNGGQVKTLEVTPQNYDVVQMVSFDDVLPGRENQVEISAEGRGTMMYQISGSYTLPWEKLALYGDLLPQQDQVKIDVSYDRTELEVNDTVNVTVRVSLNEPGAKAESALIDLGIPPGFTVKAEDLAALVARYDDVPPDYAFPTIERYDLTGRQVLVYASNLSEGSPLEFSFRLQARFPLSVQSPPSSAYDYYNPDVAGETPPQRIVVNP